MGVIRMGSVVRDKQIVNPSGDAFLQHGVAQVDVDAGFPGAGSGNGVIPGPAHGHADLFVRQVDQHLRGTEIANVRAYGFHQLFRIPEMARVYGIAGIA